MIDEQQRIVNEMSRRSRQVPADFYDLARPANRFTHDRYVASARELLEDAAAWPLEDSTLLEIGCGSGQWLRQFRAWGVKPGNIHGIDLYEPRVEEARRAIAEADIRTGDAAALPWGDAAFDIVLQSTVFTSILDPSMRMAVAREMVRVTRPDGLILWYDFTFDNPRNPNVRGIGLSEIRRLFPGFVLRHRRVTLAPPIARRVVPMSEALARVLDALPFLRTHVMATLSRS